MASKAEIKLKLKIGTIISGEMFKYYLQLLKLEYGVNEENNKNLYNICDLIEKKLATLIKNLNRDVTSVGIKEESITEQIQQYFDLVYSCLDTNLKDQKRIIGLVNKLKKEEIK